MNYKTVHNKLYKYIYFIKFTFLEDWQSYLTIKYSSLKGLYFLRQQGFLIFFSHIQFFLNQYKLKYKKTWQLGKKS